jgi:hypothetical protein
MEKRVQTPLNFCGHRLNRENDYITKSFYQYAKQFFILISSKVVKS